MVMYILDLKTPNVDMKTMLKEEFSQKKVKIIIVRKKFV